MKQKIIDKLCGLNICLKRLVNNEKLYRNGQINLKWHLQTDFESFNSTFFSIREHLIKYYPEHKEKIEDWFKERVLIGDILKHGELDRGNCQRRGCDGEYNYWIHIMGKVGGDPSQEELNDFYRKNKKYSIHFKQTKGNLSIKTGDILEIAEEYFNDIFVFLETLGFDYGKINELHGINLRS